jgi:hypothetical protein
MDRLPCGPLRKIVGSAVRACGVAGIAWAKAAPAQKVHTMPESKVHERFIVFSKP